MGGSIGVAISALFDHGVGASESSATVCAIMGMTGLRECVMGNEGVVMEITSVGFKRDEKVQGFKI